jgi:hypothetical protein
MLIFFVVVPGIYLSCAGYFYPIMLDIYTPECRIFLHCRAGLLTQFDGYSVYTSVCRFFFIVVPGIYFGHARYFSKSFQVFTPPNFYVIYAGFYIRHAGYFYLIMLYCFLSLTGIFNRIYTSACQFFCHCAGFYSGHARFLPRACQMFYLIVAGYLHFRRLDIYISACRFLRRCTRFLCRTCWKFLPNYGRYLHFRMPDIFISLC